ncbi:MAG: tRNA pseudouridine(38-40) synthase TruA [Planctomycetaceae bacterium]
MAQRNIRLTLSYDGTDFAGWQVQPNRRTVQGVVEHSIEKTSGESLRILAAGRTDSGVHALGQVANFRTESDIPPDRWKLALRAHLPDEVVVVESEEVDYDFHATFSAKTKRYRYVIYNHVVEFPFLKNYAWRISQELDVAAMHAAAQELIGKHDFRSFESHWPNKATSVRTVNHVSVRRVAEWPAWSPVATAGERVEGESTPEAPFIVLEIEADGFLYNMVRTITGTLLNVGRGNWTGNDVRRILEAMNRKEAGGTAPAHGLYLVCVHYD